jgi:hypothetical protein
MKFGSSLVLVVIMLALQPVAARAQTVDLSKSWDEINAQAAQAYGGGQLMCLSITDAAGNVAKALIFKSSNGGSKLLEKRSQHCLRKEGSAAGTKPPTPGQSKLCQLLGIGASGGSGASTNGYAVKPSSAGSSGCSTASLVPGLINLSRDMGGVPPGMKSCSVSGPLMRAQDAQRCAGEADILGTAALNEKNKGTRGLPCTPAATAISRTVEAVQNCSGTTCDDSIMTTVASAITKAKAACPTSP